MKADSFVKPFLSLCKARPSLHFELDNQVIQLCRFSACRPRPLLQGCLALPLVLGVLVFMLAVWLDPTSASAAKLLDSDHCIDRMPDPPLDEFIAVVGPLNPKASQEDLIEAWKDKFKTCHIMLTGKIQRGDVAPFRTALERTGRDGKIMLILDSEGGDLETAIEIGRLVRKWESSTIRVNLSQKCFSACVFVLAGGLERVVLGQIGIQRPFISTTKSNTYESTQKRFRALEQTAKAFLKEVNLPPSLYDEMMSISPEKSRLLTKQELVQWGIVQNDLVYQDNLDAETARELVSPAQGAEILIEGRQASTMHSCTMKEPEFKMDADAFLIIGNSKKIRLYGVCPMTVRFSGSINAASMTKLRSVLEAAVEKARSNITLLTLNSAGGDVWEALAFANFVRKKNYHYVAMFVGEKDFCYSSCVIILAGGYKRTILGNVGIHRPFFSKARAQEMGYSNMKKAYDALHSELSNFFNSTNISERLADDMWQVPSHENKELTPRELDAYGLSRNDAVLTEMDNASLRDSCGSETAPIDRQDFFDNILIPCIDAERRVDSECANRRGLKKHPFCRCMAQFNPGSELFVCD